MIILEIIIKITTIFYKRISIQLIIMKIQKDNFLLKFKEIKEEIKETEERNERNEKENKKTTKKN